MYTGPLPCRRYTVEWHLHHVQVPKDEKIDQNGGGSFYIIEKGSVDIVDKTTGKRTTLRYRNLIEISVKFGIWHGQAGRVFWRRRFAFREIRRKNKYRSFRENRMHAARHEGRSVQKHHQKVSFNDDLQRCRTEWEQGRFTDRPDRLWHCEDRAKSRFCTSSPKHNIFISGIKQRAGRYICTTSWYHDKMVVISWQVETISSMLEDEKKYAKDVTIFREGERDASLFFVKRVNFLGISDKKHCEFSLKFQ